MATSRPLRDEADEGRVVFTDILIERPWMSPAALILLITLGPLIGAWLVPRQQLARLLLAASLLPVAVLTLVPIDRELYARCSIALEWSLPTPGEVESLANVVLFVAPVLLAGVVLRRPLLACILGSVLSLGLEALQALLLSIGRSCDSSDWFANTLGAAIGALLAAVALLLARRTTPHAR